jgi:hypothetical protein
MSVPLLIVSALVGWCGTPWPRRWPWPWPPPGPDPDPWLTKVIGVVGGLIGGFVVGQLADPGLLAAVVGGWVGAVLLSEIYGLATPGLKRG